MNSVYQALFLHHLGMRRHQKDYYAIDSDLVILV